MINTFSNASPASHGLSFPENPGLSFGPAGSSVERNDAWGVPPLGLASKKKSTLEGFNGNPWS